MDRRLFLQGTGALALSAASIIGFSRSASAQSIEIDELMKLGTLPEMTLGADDAPVTIVEYASMTCGHCANFHKNTYPDLKKDYIDTGKVRFVFREFPLDTVALGAFMMARCSPEDKYFEIVDLLFADQRSWAFTDDPYNAMLGIAKQIGFTQETFDACLQNQEILDGITWVKDRAANDFGVNSTPTLIVNGEVQRGALSFDELEKVVQSKM
ncbi:MAG: DsbA family protein [Stappiaceae bacterium]